jgi:hypothetical protein
MVAEVHGPLIFVDVGKEKTLEPSCNIGIQAMVELWCLMQELKAVVQSGTQDSEE